MNEQVTIEPLACPFCGDDEPFIEPWHGGRPTKHMVSCDNAECHVAPHVTGETREEAIERWNMRASK